MCRVEQPWEHSRYPAALILSRPLPITMKRTAGYISLGSPSNFILNNMAFAYLASCFPCARMELPLQSIAHSRENGILLIEAESLATLALVSVESGHLHSARTVAADAVARLRTLGKWDGLATALSPRTRRRLPYSAMRTEHSSCRSKAYRQRVPSVSGILEMFIGAGLRPR